MQGQKMVVGMAKLKREIRGELFVAKE